MKPTFEFIVITPGIKGEELKNLKNFENIKTSFIFCGNILIIIHMEKIDFNKMKKDHHR